MKAETHLKESEPRQKLERFKRLLHDLAARIVCSTAGEICPGITGALEAAGEFWRLDWVCLAELSPDRKRIETTHAYVAERAGTAPPELTDEAVGQLVERLAAEEAVTIDRGQILPAGKSPASRSRNKALVVPARSHEALEALLILPPFRGRFGRSKELLDDLHYLGRILAGGMERKKAVEGITELRRFEKLLSQISATYINLPVEEIEKTLKKDFGRLGRLLKADRFNLYLISEDRTSFNLEERFAWWPQEDDLLIQKIEREDIKTRALFDKSHYLFEKWRKGEVCKFSRLEDLPEEARDAKSILTKFRAKSYLSIPITLAGSTAGAFTVVTTRRHRTWSDDLIPRLRLFGEVFINAMARKQSEEKLRAAFSEISKLKDRIEADYVYLRDEIKLEYDFGNIVGQSEAMRKILLKVRQVAPTNATVLILGETGTGKGLIARAVHNSSARKERPLIQVNCAALAGSLIESELFGHEKGAFTGAQVNKAGRFEAANGTTLFLDEIGDLPLESQPKLLRVLQEGEFERVGGSVTLKTDVRIIAATNKDLEKEVEAGRFRRDLWYRLNVFPINAPPLRERLPDIPLFVDFFMDKYRKWIGKEFAPIDKKTVRGLQAYSWPGNIRELKNLVERAVITSPEGRLQIEIPKDKEREARKRAGGTMADMERAYILEVLNETHWRVNGPYGAASILGLNPSTLRFRMKSLGIERPLPYRT